VFKIEYDGLITFGQKDNNNNLNIDTCFDNIPKEVLNFININI